MNLIFLILGIFIILIILDNIRLDNHTENFGKKKNKLKNN